MTCVCALIIFYNMKNRDFLTEFEIAELKKVCWNNIGEFYIRYGKDLDMSQSWFYRALQGAEVSEKTVDNVRKVLDKIHILNAPDLKDVFEDIIDKVDTFSKSHDFSDFVKIETWIKKYGPIFKELY